MGICLDDQAFRTAASDMLELKKRNQRLREKLERMYHDLTTALDTPAGHALEWTGRDILLEPIDDMSKVLEQVSNTLNVIIGQNARQDSEQRGTYYDRLFAEYEELDQILKNKRTC